MLLNGAQILIESLKREKVEVIFGYPGGAVLPIFDEFYKTGVNLLEPRHEQAAAHMADGYARATGKVGVCLATSGPGATNLVTGIATAHLDSIPVVAITGQVNTSLIGNDAFQEVDTKNIFGPISKYTILVKNVASLSRLVKEAFHVAKTGRPGPVVIDLPVDATKAETKFENSVLMNLRGYRPTKKIPAAEIKAVMEAIVKAKRPLLYIGGGVISANAQKELNRFVKITDIPVTMTLMALGAYPTTEKLCLGMLGMHGTIYANLAVQNCDLLISIGARFDDRVTGDLKRFAPKAKIIHLDIDPSSIGKNVKVDLEIIGDAKDALKQIIAYAKKLSIDNWRAQVQNWKEKNPLKYDRKSLDLKPQYVMEQIEKIIDGRGIIVTDVGQHQMWSALWISHTRARAFLSSGGLGTMGFGLPAAMGAQIGKPKKKVVAITGDGGFQMNIQELATLTAYQIPVKIFIINNGYLGMVRQWQELFFNKHYSHTDLEKINPEFTKVAAGFGIQAEKVADKKDVAPAIKRALNYPGPYILDFRVSREENVFPMVPAGKAIDHMLV